MAGIFIGSPSLGQADTSAKTTIEVNLSQVNRSHVPTTLFGFNINWMRFQEGYWRNGRVRTEVVDWLKPFTGAVYRYPGGTVSNVFEWEKSVGPTKERVLLPNQFNQVAVPEYGFDEFIAFVKAVNGIPLIVANLRGPKEQPWDPAKSAEINAGWVRYANKKSTGRSIPDKLLPCEPDKPCPVLLWELGNEMDRLPSWDSAKYTAWARQVGLAMKNVDPSIRLIANSASAPWGDKTKAAEFNTKVGELKDLVSGYSFHPYYDGILVPKMGKFIQQIQEQVGKIAGKDVDVYVTEHARWPSKPLLGPWNKNWSQTGDVSGALATADFMLMILPMESVQTAMWHKLGVHGPWQLFYVDEVTERPYPNVVYWALRALRTGLLNQVLAVQVFSPNTSGYGGGYDVRAVFMRDQTGKRHSLLAVNRASVPQHTTLIVPQWAGRQFNASCYYVSGTAATEANTAEKQDAIVLRSNMVNLRFDQNGKAQITLPPYSVSAYLIM